jgi:hypothetical protein
MTNTPYINPNNNPMGMPIECKHKWVLIAQQMQCEYCGKIYEVK